MMKLSRPALAAVLALALAGPAAAQQFANLKGQVVYKGDPLPENSDANVDKDQEHCLANGNKVKRDDWVVNPKNKGLQHVVVWLVPETGAELPVHDDLKTPKVKEVEVDQPQCAFVPHLVAMQEGQTLVVKNSAPVPHNVKWDTPASSGNVQIPAGGVHKITDWQATRVPAQINCNIHPWMNGYVACYKHPYFAITNADGKFEMKNAPVGKFKMVVWHQNGYLGGRAGRAGREVEIAAAGTDLGAIEFKPNP